MATKWQTVELDGVKYVPRDIVIPDECIQALNTLYCIIWAEACYDPTNKSTEDFAKRLAPHIQLLNDNLKFKR